MDAGTGTSSPESTVSMVLLMDLTALHFFGLTFVLVVLPSIVSRYGVFASFGYSVLLVAACLRRPTLSSRPPPKTVAFPDFRSLHDGVSGLLFAPTFNRLLA
jgi:hypothetical protein